MEKYKFEGFEVGQKIRAEDFEPRIERGPCFVEGVILAINREATWQVPFAHYAIRCTRNVWLGEDDQHRIGTMINVPMETSMDWDSRVQAVAS